MAPLRGVRFGFERRLFLNLLGFNDHLARPAMEVGAGFGSDVAQQRPLEILLFRFQGLSFEFFGQRWAPIIIVGMRPTS
jgi:hypothetical protein